MPKKILIVEDDPFMSRSLVRTFAREGYATSVAENAADAIELIRTEVFDLVVSDNTMPGMPGIELLDVLAMRKPDLPTILHSSDPQDSLTHLVRERGLKESVMRYFVQKGDHRALLAKIKELIGEP